MQKGNEATILCATDPADWKATDAVVEMGSAENADQRFRRFNGIEVTFSWSKSELASGKVARSNARELETWFTLYFV